MTSLEMITMLNGMGFTDNDTVLSTYLSFAGDAIINRAFPYAKDDEELEVPRKYQLLQVQIAAFLLDKRGAEGQVRHDENGISRTFASADIPDDMLSQIVAHVGVIE